ncbi:unnamed protein product, partial [Adineta steineri]
MVSVPEGWFR